MKNLRYFYIEIRHAYKTIKITTTTSTIIIVIIIIIIIIIIHACKGLSFF